MRINHWSLKMISLDILTTSPHYFYEKGIGKRKENLYFDIDVKGLSYKSTTRISNIAPREKIVGREKNEIINMSNCLKTV